MPNWKRHLNKKIKENSQQKRLSSQNDRPKKATEKTGSLEGQLPKLKEQRRKKMYRRLIPLLLLFSFAILIVVYFVSPLSKVGTISVVGNSDVTDQRVINSSQMRSGLPLWGTLWSGEDYTSAVLKDIPQIKKAELNHKWWNNIAIEIDEHEVIAYSYDGSYYYPILENGKIVNESRQVSIGNNPLFKNFAEGKPLDLLIEQYQLLTSSVKNSISEIEHTESPIDDYQIKLYMNDGNHVIATLPTFAEKMNYYPDMIQKTEGQKGVINLEVGGFFVPFEKKEEKSSVEEKTAESEMTSETNNSEN